MRQKRTRSTPRRPCRSWTGWIVALALLWSAPASAEPKPLLVVLHGDGERASAARTRWERVAKQRGFVVFAPQVPSGTSWWKWNGDPQWLKDRVAKIAGVDPKRIYAAGWSGGATYLGMRAHAWGDTFAALVAHGGGMAPADDACPDRTPPAYFLVGDANPLHHLAGDMHEFFARCEKAVVWDLVRGGDHAGERRALDAKKARVILDWLVTHTRK